MTKKLSLILFAGLLFQGSLLAGPFKISNAQCQSNTPACTSLLAQINTELKNVEDEVNKSLPTVDAERYANGMANSLLISSKGLSVDYGSNISLFVVGGGLGLGFDAGDKSFSDSMKNPATISGIGSSLSAMVGLNLGLLPIPEFGPIDPKKAVLFANVAAMDIPKVVNELSGSYASFGLHARYRMIDNWSLLKGLAEWSGVDVTTGFNYSSLDFKIKPTLEQAIDQELATNTTMEGTYKTTAILGPDIGIFNIPVEVSSGVRFLYIFRLYGGLGLDFTMGTSKITVEAPGNLTADFKVSGVTQDTITANTSLDLGGSSRPDFFGLRGFGGLQLDFSVINIFVQGNTSFTAGTYGFSVGARAFW